MPAAVSLHEVLLAHSHACPCAAVTAGPCPGRGGSRGPPAGKAQLLASALGSGLGRLSSAPGSCWRAWRQARSPSRELGFSRASVPCSSRAGQRPMARTTVSEEAILRPHPAFVRAWCAGDVRTLPARFCGPAPAQGADWAHQTWRGELGLAADGRGARSRNGTDPRGRRHDAPPTGPRLPSATWPHRRSGALTRVSVVPIRPPDRTPHGVTA